MGRLSAVFVAICMVLIACSIGAVLFLRFGLSGTESAIVTLTALTGLALYNAVSTRVQDGGAGASSGQVGDLARGIADLARQVTELNRRVAAIEGRTQAAVENMTQPINAEMGEVGGLIMQIAEAVAAHDTQLKELTPAAIGPTPVPVPVPAPELEMVAPAPRPSRRPQSQAFRRSCHPPRRPWLRSRRPRRRLCRCCRRECLPRRW